MPEFRPPYRTDFLSLRTCPVLNNISAHVDKHFICITHFFLSPLQLYGSAILYRTFSSPRSKAATSFCQSSRKLSVQFPAVRFHFTLNIIRFSVRKIFFFRLSAVFGTQKNKTFPLPAASKVPSPSGFQTKPALHVPLVDLFFISMKQNPVPRTVMR